MKRRICFLIFFIVYLSGLIAQADSGMGKVICWVYKYTKDFNEHNDTITGWFDEERYIFVGWRKLEFGGKEYYEVYHDFRPKPINTDAPVKQKAPRRRLYSIGIRREDGKVFANYDDFREYQNYRFNYELFLPCCWSFSDPNYLPYHLTEDGSELILYDYTMEVGDGFRHVDGHDDITVVEKDTVAYADDVPRRRLTLSNGLIIIEGMGCINSNGMLIDWLNPAEEYQSNFTYLDYCADDWNKPFNIIYTHEDSGLHVVDTNPAGIEPLQASESPSGHAIFDLQGRRLSAPLSKGIYIQDGRKRIVK